MAYFFGPPCILQCAAGGRVHGGRQLTSAAEEQRFAFVEVGRVLADAADAGQRQRLDGLLDSNAPLPLHRVGAFRLRHVAAVVVTLHFQRS